MITPEVGSVRLRLDHKSEIRVGYHLASVYKRVTIQGSPKERGEGGRELSSGARPRTLPFHQTARTPQFYVYFPTPSDFLNSGSVIEGMSGFFYLSTWLSARMRGRVWRSRGDAAIRSELLIGHVREAEVNTTGSE